MEVQQCFQRAERRERPSRIGYPVEISLRNEGGIKTSPDKGKLGDLSLCANSATTSEPVIALKSKVKEKRAKDLNRHFAKENIQIINKHTEGYSTSLVIREFNFKP